MPFSQSVGFPSKIQVNINSTQVKCLAIFAIFAIIGFGPVSPGCLIGMYVVVMRPEWFLLLTEKMYNHRQTFPFITAKQTRATRIKSFLSLLTLFVIDIAPVPVTPVVAFVIILVRPQWFYRVVRSVYGEVA